MTAILIHTNRGALSACFVKVDGLRDATSPGSVVNHRWVDPPLLRARDAVGVCEPAVVDAVEVHSSVVSRARQDGAVGELAGCFGDEPVARVLLEAVLKVGLATPVLRLGDLHDFAEIVE